MDESTTILGISALYHDSAACLLKGDRIVACALEERFTRVKHDPGFPEHAIDYVLAQGGLTTPDIVVFYEKPILKLERLLETYMNEAPRGARFFVASVREYLARKLWIKDRIRKRFGNGVDILFSTHHLSHAASAFFASPFAEAAVLTMDGVGEWQTTTMYHGQDNTLIPLQELRFPHSLGLLYSAFTDYLGFRVNNDEYKVMGLAPYGEPKYVQAILDNLVDLGPDGAFRLNMAYFAFNRGLRMTGSRFHSLFGGPPRPKGVIPGQREADLARSIQEVAEEVILRQAGHIKDLTGSENLAMAGGVALNCVANGKVLGSGLFKKIWIQPAASDAGGALGAALAVRYLHLKAPRARARDMMQGAFLGPEYTNGQVKAALDSHGWQYRQLDQPEMVERIAEMLARGQVVGIFRGREEFGPRALGNRSILADPTDPEMKARINGKIKFREPFRPFAPAVAHEAEARYFQPVTENPYMVITTTVRRELWLEDRDSEPWYAKKSVIPAVTHFDHSARVQSVKEATHTFFHALLKAFQARKGHPVLLNTSFNLRGEPIVSTPTDAMRTFANSDMDAMVMNDLLVTRADMGRKPPALPRRHTASRVQAMGPGGLAVGLAVAGALSRWPLWLTLLFGALAVLLLLLAVLRPSNAVVRAAIRAQKALVNSIGTFLLYLTYFAILSWLGPVSRRNKKVETTSWIRSEPVESISFDREF